MTARGSSVHTQRIWLPAGSFLGRLIHFALSQCLGQPGRSRSRHSHLMLPAPNPCARAQQGVQRPLLPGAALAEVGSSLERSGRCSPTLDVAASVHTTSCCSPGSHSSVFRWDLRPCPCPPARCVFSWWKQRGTFVLDFHPPGGAGAGPCLSPPPKLWLLPIIQPWLPPRLWGFDEKNSSGRSPARGAGAARRSSPHTFHSPRCGRDQCLLSCSHSWKRQAWEGGLSPGQAFSASCPQPGERSLDSSPGQAAASQPCPQVVLTLMRLKGCPPQALPGLCFLEVECL